MAAQRGPVAERVGGHGFAGSAPFPGWLWFGRRYGLDLCFGQRFQVAEVVEVVKRDDARDGLGGGLLLVAGVFLGATTTATGG